MLVSVPACPGATPAESLDKIQGVFFQILQRAIFQRADFSGPQQHPGCGAGEERLGPARRAKAPAIARLQARKAIFWHRCAKIIPALFGKRQKLRRHLGTDRVAAGILRPGRATAIAKKPGNRIIGTRLQHPAQNIQRLLPPLPAAAIQWHAISCSLGISVVPVVFASAGFLKVFAKDYNSYKSFKEKWSEWNLPQLFVYNSFDWKKAEEMVSSRLAYLVEVEGSWSLVSLTPQTFAEDTQPKPIPFPIISKWVEKENGLRNTGF